MHNVPYGVVHILRSSRVIAGDDIGLIQIHIKRRGREGENVGEMIDILAEMTI